MLQDVKEKVMQFGVSSPTLLGVTGNLQGCGHFQPPPYQIGLTNYSNGNIVNCLFLKTFFKKPL